MSYRFFLILFFCYIPLVTAAPEYYYYVSDVKVTDLGTLGGADAEAMDINNSGSIVGWSTVKDGRKVAFLYRYGAMAGLDPVTTGNEVAPVWRGSVANGINDLDEIVGHSLYSGSSTPDDTYAIGFYWANGVSTLLTHKWGGGTLPEYKYGGSAKAINNQGHIAGVSYRYTRAETSTMWYNYSGASVRLMPNNIAFTDRALDINNNTDMVGITLGPDYGVDKGYLFSMYSGWVFHKIPMVLKSGDIVYSFRWANALNDNGDVAGYYEANPGNGYADYHALFWPNYSKHAMDIGTLPNGKESRATDVNLQQYVVGESDHTLEWGGTGNSAFLWYSGFGLNGGESMYRLPQLTIPGTITPPPACRANAMNDLDSETNLLQVVGYCKVGARKHAVLWDVKIAKARIKTGDQNSSQQTDDRLIQRQDNTRSGDMILRPVESSY